MSEKSPPPKTNYRSGAMDIVFGLMLISSILVAAYNGTMKQISEQSFEAAKSAVSLSIGLVGIMALWLGLVRILEAGGFMYTLARMLRPIMQRLFPDVPRNHPAMGAMVLNISANMLGLGNAATPFGLKAMTELKKLSPIPNTATNAMCLFLTINTAGVALLPLGVIGVRAAAGAADPAAIWIPTNLATISSLIIGVAAAMYLAKRDTKYTAEVTASNAVIDLEEVAQEVEATKDEYQHLRGDSGTLARGISLLIVLMMSGAFVLAAAKAPNLKEFVVNEVFSFWLMPTLMLAIMLYGVSRGVKVYEAVTEGGKQGFDTAVRIIPFLVAILVAIGMFRASGAMDIVAAWLNPITSLVGMPAETLPMAIIRPLSGSGAFAIMSEMIKSDPNSYEAYVASVMMGSTETTFYVLAVYYGSVGVVRFRHALAAGIIADVAGLVGACIFSKMFFVG